MSGYTRVHSCGCREDDGVVTLCTRCLTVQMWKDALLRIFGRREV